MAKHPGQMNHSYGRIIATGKGALIGILTPLSICEVILMQGLEYWQNISKKIMLHLTVKDIDKVIYCRSL